MKRIKAFYRLFLSYLCWFIIPFLLIIYFILQNVLNIYKADILSQNISYSEFIKDSLDEQMKIRETIIYMLINDDIIMNFDAAIYHDKSDLVLAERDITDILKYCSRYQDSLLSNALYYEKAQIIIDANMAYTVENYYERFVKDTGAELESFKEYLNGDVSDVYLGTDTYFLSIMPMRKKTGGGEKIVSLVIFDTQAMLKKYLYLTNYVTKQYLVIADDKQNILLKADDMPEWPQLEQTLSEIDSGVNEIDGGRAYIIENKSIIKGIRYYSIFYTSDIYEHFRMMIALLVLGLLACIIIMTCIAYIVSRKLFMPFKLLAENKTVTVNIEDSKSIESLITDIICNNVELHTEIGNQKKMLDSNLFKLFLNNSSEMDEETIAKIFDKKLNFSGESIQSVVVYIDEDDEDKRAAAVFMIATALHNREEHDCLKHFSIPTDSQYLIFVMNHSMQSNEFFQTITGVFMPIIEENKGIRVGIGRSVSEPRMFSKSYEEALIAVETGNDVINRYNGSEWMTGKEFIFQGSQKNELINYVCNGEVNNVEDFFETLMQKMFGRNILTAGIIAYVRFALIDLYTQTVNDAGMRGRKTDADISRCRSTLESRNFAESFDIIRQAFINLTVNIGDSKGDKRDEIKDKIIAYVDEHYANPDLSIRQIAEDMNMSYGHLCKFFKEETGVTMLAYLHRRRIDAAKEMLIETNKSVLEIAKETGYLSLNSFVKKFKQLEYMSPTEFRSKNQK